MAANGVFDVLVAGGGPAGSTTASHLARQGFAVLLCDAVRFPRPKICGEYLPPPAAAHFERLGVAQSIAALRPLRPLGMAVIAPGGTRVLGRYRGAATGFSLRRLDLDAALLHHAGRCGVEVREGARVEHFERDRNGIYHIDLEPMNVRVRARALVGADGRNSLVARRLGLRRQEPHHRRWAVMAHYECVETPVGHGEMIVTPYGYCGLNPLPGGLCNVCIVVDPRRREWRIPGRRDLQSFFDAAIARVPATRRRLLGACRAGPLLATGPMACRTRDVVADGALLVGDAAGFFDPFTGEGIYMALRGGEMAAETLAECLRRDRLTAAHLSPYARRRRAAFEGRLRLDRVLQRILASPRLTDWTVGKLARDQRLADLLARVAGDMAGAGELLRPRFMARLLIA
jgi:geranylgeranyl reductase family protein